MKKRGHSRLCAVGLAICTLVSGVPVNAQISDVKDSVVLEDQEDNTKESERVTKNENDSEVESSATTKENPKVEKDSSETSSEETSTEEPTEDASEETLAEEEKTEEETTDVDEEQTTEESTEEEKVLKETKVNKNRKAKVMYSFDFEDGKAGKGSFEDEAEVIEDEKKGKVLHLNGKASLTLPEELFEDVTEDGFTISMWVKPDESAGAYTKVFDASNAPLGKTYNGDNDWSDPDFALAVGGDVYDMTLYVGEKNTKCDSKTKLKYDKHLKKGEWQYMTVAVSPEEYSIYLNGEKVRYQDKQGNTQEIEYTLQDLFTDGYINSLKYASIGKSYYTSDADFKGDVDDITFFDKALGKKEVSDLYQSFESMLKDDEKLPKSVYTFDFEDGTAGAGEFKDNAKVVDDEKKGKILHLDGKASMALPEDLFKEMKDELTISMWVKPDKETGSYTKIFDASNAELGKTYDGGNSWSAPDFALATGGDVYDLTLYVGEPESNCSARSKLKYEKHLEKDEWQYMTVTMTKDAYHVYFDGKEVDYEDAQGNTQAITDVLPELFKEGYLQSLKYASIGKSYYTSDADFKGDVDDISFYNKALTKSEVEKIYENFEFAKENEVTIPESVYSFDFEKELAEGALLNDAKVVEDKTKKSKVLQLPGNGSMPLPKDLFEKMAAGEEKGFTIAMWVKADNGTNQYTKFFDASNAPIGASERGSNWWSDPDFALAAGGGAYDLTLYVGEPNSSCASKTKLKYAEQLTRDKWQYFTLSVNPDEIKVYLDGVNVEYDDAQDGTKQSSEVLKDLFAEGYLETLKYASIGKSYYTSDADFKGSVDDISFYAEALDARQVKALFETFDKIEAPKAQGTLTVNMDKKTGEVKHGATGFLYGIGEDNVPNVNLMTAIKPYMCEQKPAEGLQHPNGDILSMAKTFIEAGGDSIQIACPDIYANWPYEYEGLEEYCEKLETMVKQTAEAGLSDKAVYVLFNEPEGNWFSEIWSNNMENFNKSWKKAYDTVKAIDPKAKVAGPNFCCFQSRQLKTFMEFCAQNDCIPTQMTWHVLNDDLYMNFPNNVREFRENEKKIWLDTGKTSEKMEIVINEYADFTHLGVPGSLARWIGLFEDEKVTACLAYWHISNNLCDLVASNNEPNGAWWLYKWYAELSGETLSIDTEGIKKTKFYGVASIDDNKKSANVIWGGADSTQVILKDIDKTGVFGDKIKVKFESTDWTGINGAAEAPFFMKEEIFAVDENGCVEINMEDLVAAAAYNLTITPADDEAEVGIVTEGPWKKAFEGEEAKLSGGARKAGTNPNFACSGTGQAQNINGSNAKVTFEVDVPEDGYYRFDMVYGAATGNDTMNTAKNDPQNAVQKLYVDNNKQADMYLENTLTFYMSGLHTEYVYLEKGEHELTVTGSDSKGKATIDCAYLTFVGDKDALYQEQNVKEYEAELSDYNILGSQTSTKVKTKSSIKDYSGSGYAVGLDTSVKDGGGIRFVTFAKDNGIYDLTLRYASDEKAEINYYINNTNKTLDHLVKTNSVASTGKEWKETTVKVFLEKGINIIDLDASSSSLAVDKLIIEKGDNSSIDTIEAESCKMIGDVDVADNSVASNGKYVKEIRAAKDASNALVVNYDAPKDGVYQFVVYQSNKELFGSHSYNAQMIDRFVTIAVNGDYEQTVYFRNTYSVDSFRSQCVQLELKKGNNEIKLYNNDYRVHKNGVGGKNICVNYTPNFDKFEVAFFMDKDYSPKKDDPDKKDDDEKKDEDKKDEETPKGDEGQKDDKPQGDEGQKGDKPQSGGNQKNDDKSSSSKKKSSSKSSSTATVTTVKEETKVLEQAVAAVQEPATIQEQQTPLADTVKATANTVKNTAKTAKSDSEKTVSTTVKETTEKEVDEVATEKETEAAAETIIGEVEVAKADAAEVIENNEEVDEPKVEEQVVAGNTEEPVEAANVTEVSNAMKSQQMPIAAGVLFGGVAIAGAAGAFVYKKRK